MRESSHNLTKSRATGDVSAEGRCFLSDVVVVVVVFVRAVLHPICFTERASATVWLVRANCSLDRVSFICRAGGGRETVWRGGDGSVKAPVTLQRLMTVLCYIPARACVHMLSTATDWPLGHSQWPQYIECNDHHHSPFLPIHSVIVYYFYRFKPLRDHRMMFFALNLCSLRCSVESREPIARRYRRLQPQ